MELKFFSAYEAAWIMALAKSTDIQELFEISREQGVPSSIESVAIRAIELIGPTRDYSHIVEFLHHKCNPRLLTLFADRHCPGNKHVLNFVYQVILAPEVTTRILMQARIAESFAFLDPDMMGYAKKLVAEYLDNDFYIMAAEITAKWEQFILDDIDDSDDEETCIGCTERFMREAGTDSDSDSDMRE